MATTSDLVIESKNGNSQSHEELINERNSIYNEIDEIEFNFRYLLEEDNFQISLTTFNSLVLKLRNIDKQLGKKFEKQSEKYYDKILSIRKIFNERNTLEREEERKNQIMQAQIEMIKAPTVTSIPAQSSRRSVAICPDDLRLTPFDGTPCNYRQFEILFEEVYEKNENYSEAQLFLLFRNLVGDKGRAIISTLKPDAAGLKTAKQRMRAHFQNSIRVRESIRNNLQRLPMVTDPSNTEGLRLILTALEEAIDSLEDCETNVQLINDIFLQIVLPKIPRSIKSSYISKYLEWNAKLFVDFFYNQIQLEMSLNETEYHNFERSSSPETRATATTSKSTSTSTAVVNSPNRAQGPSQQQGCKICDQNHSTILCDFQDAKARKNIASMKGLCFRCLRPNHRLADCTSRYVCRCGGIHSSVLCFRNNSNTRISAITSPSTNSSSEPSHHQQSSIEESNENQRIQVNLIQIENLEVEKSQIENSQIEKSQVEDLKIENLQIYTTNRNDKHEECRSYAPTFLVRIGDIVTRVLFDTGAERSIVSEKLATKLKLPIVYHHHLPISGFEATSPRISKQTVRADLRSISNDYCLNTTLVVVPNMPIIEYRTLTDDEQQILNRRGYEIPDISHDRNRSIPIEIILGQDYCWEIGIKSSTRIHQKLHMIHTRFGYMLSGIIKGKPVNNPRKFN